MPPKAVGRGGQAPRRAGVVGPSARRSDQGAAAVAESSTTNDNAPSTASGTATSPPSRPSVQRLQSINRRTPGGSIGPRGGAVGLGLGLDKSKPTLKFQPRTAGRRAKEERDALQEMEAERQRKKMSEAAELQRARLGNAARARGTFRGRGWMHRGGLAGGTKRGGAGVGGRGGGFGGYTGDSRASSASVSRYHTPTWGRGSGADYSSDEDTAALRISIDHININEDDNDGNGSDEEGKALKDRKGKRSVKSSMRSLSIGPRPVRVERHEHEERIVSVNTEASSSVSAELRRQAQEDDDSDNELFMSETTTQQLDQGSVVKSEPADGDVSMADVPYVAHDGDELLPPQTVKARKRVTVQDPRSLLQTKEEIEEFDRHNDDLDVLKNILTPAERAEKATKAVDGTQTEGEEDGSEKEDPKEEQEEEEELDKNAGRLFMIQFPPLTPNLVVPGVREEGVIDVEEDNDSTEDVIVTQENTTTTIWDTDIKREEDEDVKSKVGIASQPVGNLVTATQRQMPAGRVGQLHLHKSGRVTLDWGGISFELDKGASVNFVQQALIASTPGEGAQDGERLVWAMGQLSEKFIASPEWDKLL